MGGKVSEVDLKNALVNKADVSDVSRAVTEIIQTVDYKRDIEELRKQV